MIARSEFAIIDNNSGMECNQAKTFDDRNLQGKAELGCKEYV